MDYRELAEELRSPSDGWTGYALCVDADVAARGAEAIAKLSNSWKCFHCHEIFTDFVEAREHFGYDEDSKPACILKREDGGLVKAVRFLEEQNKDLHHRLGRYCEDDSAADRRIAGMICDHHQALQRAEEKGYARGIEDMRFPKHILYKTGDTDAPDVIKDRNGEIVLGLCRLCGKGESELEEPCKETAASIAQWAQDTFGHATPLSTAIRALRELAELIHILNDGHDLSMNIYAAKLTELSEIMQRQEAITRKIVTVTTDEVGRKAMYEVADVRIVLARFERFFGHLISIDEAEQKKMDINRRRTWKLDGAGHGQHV